MSHDLISDKLKEALVQARLRIQNRDPQELSQTGLNRYRVMRNEAPVIVAPSKEILRHDAPHSEG